MFKIMPERKENYVGSSRRCSKKLSDIMPLILRETRFSHHQHVSDCDGSSDGNDFTALLEEVYNFLNISLWLDSTLLMFATQS